NVIAHRTGADDSETLTRHRGWLTWTFMWAPAQSSRTASDQDQPANSRAIAALATTGRFLRWSKLAHRVCSPSQWHRAATSVVIEQATASLVAQRESATHLGSTLHCIDHGSTHQLVNCSTGAKNNGDG